MRLGRFEALRYGFPCEAPQPHLGWAKKKQFLYLCMGRTQLRWWKR